MTRRLLISLLLINTLISGAYSQNIINDNKVRETVRLYGQAEVSVSYPGIKAIDFLTRNVSILSIKDNIVFISLSELTVEWFLSRNYTYKLSIKDYSKGISSAQNLSQAMSWETYPTYTQYDSIMKSFATLYPSLCRLDTIGRSVNGKQVLVLKISDNPMADEDEPEVFYTSTIHGDETGGYILMMRLADYLLKNYQTSSRARNIVDNMEVWINPLANPDGTYNSGNRITFPTRFNANGVDLNRNFPDPFIPNTIQQKENIDMINFMEKHRPVISANFHSGAEVFNYPWDRWLNKYHADDTWFNSIGRSYADTAHIFGGADYMNQLENGVTRGAVWYVVYGGRQDFVTYELQGREVTIELDDDFITPANKLSQLWNNNWHSLLGYLENALYGIHGLVQNSVTSEPVAARVFIPGHDKDSSQIYSDKTFGRFIRMLAPGSWNLTFRANGYRDTILTNVILYSGQSKDIIVSMEPLSANTDSILSASPVLFPNPASAEVKALLPYELSGLLNISICSLNGKIIADYNTTAEKNIPVTIDIELLPSGVYTIVFASKASGVSKRSRLVVIK